MNSLSTNVKKLNIFQKIRGKIFFLRKFNYERYANAQEYIKLSDKFASKIPIDGFGHIKYLELIPESKIPELIDKYLIDINDLTERQQIDIIKQNPQKSLDIKNLMQLIDCAIELKDYTFFDIINSDRRIEVEYLMHLKENKALDVVPNLMQYFTQATVEKLLQQKPELINYLGEENQKKHLQNKIEDFKYLSQENQLKYIRENIEYLQYASNEIQMDMYRQDNSVFEMLSLDAKLQTICNYPQMFEMISYDLKQYIHDNFLQNERCASVIRNLIYTDIENVKLLNLTRIIEQEDLQPIFKDINMQDIEKIKEVFLNSKLLSAYGKIIPSDIVFHGGTGRRYIAGIDDYSSTQVQLIKSLSVEQVKELINIDSNYGLAYLMGEDANFGYEEVLTEDSIEESKSKCKKLMRALYGVEKSQELDESIELLYSMIKENIGKCYNAIYHNIKTNDAPTIVSKDTRKILENNPYELLKVLLNKDIVMSNTPEVIKQFFEEQRENPESQEKFYELIKNAYGDKALEILKSRPGLNVHSINSLEIFNDNILNTFGIGFVHDLLSYNFRDFSGFLSIIKDESKLEIFKDYYYILSQVLGQNAETMQKAISEYVFNEKLLQDIENRELTDEEYQSLISILISDKNPYNIRKLEELDNYKQISNDRAKKIFESLREQIKLESEKTKSERDDFTENIKAEICKDFIGIRRGEDENGYNYGTDIRYICSLYDIQSEKSKTEIYSKEEQEMLDIMYFINRELDPQKLIELAERFQEQEVTRNPLIAFQAVHKVEENELAIYNDSLLTVEKMEELCSKEENKSLIQKRIVKGQTVYILQGIPFNILVHDSGSVSLDELIEYDGQLGNSVICSRNLSGDVINRAFKERNGKTPGWGGVGYTNVEGVIANSGKDASTNQSSKLIRTTGDILVKLNEPIVEDASETSFPRRIRDHKKISNENHGGKILPDVWVRFIDDSSEDLEKEIQSENKYQLPYVIIDLSKYRDREMDIEKMEERSGR